MSPTPLLFCSKPSLPLLLSLQALFKVLKGFFFYLLVFMHLLLFLSGAMYPPFKAPTVSPALFFSPESFDVLYPQLVLPMSLKGLPGPMSFASQPSLQSSCCFYSLEASLFLHDSDLHIHHARCFHTNTAPATLCSCGPFS